MPPKNPLRDELYQIFLDHNFELSETEKYQFQIFLESFQEYNSHTNLSAIRDEKGIVEKHFVDSLYGAIIIQNLEIDHGNILDIWSGWGFPGIPLKIVLPNFSVTLLDSVGKKTRAQNIFIEKIGLSDIAGIQNRAEILSKNPEYAQKFDIVVSRATAYISEIIVYAKPFLKKNGKILLYKMPSDEESRDRNQALKKHNLILKNTLSYNLGDKKRVIYHIEKK